MPFNGGLVGLVAFLTLSAATAAQSTQTRVERLPEWMSEFLPKSSDERAKAAAFDSEGSWVLELGSGVVTTSCGFAMTGTPPAYYDFVAARACSYDAAVVGVPTPVAVRLNNRGTWLYTEHLFQVRRWISPGTEIVPEIEVLTTGGVLHVQGKTTTVHSRQQIEAGKEYLIFLKRVPNSRAFTVVGLPLSDSPAWESSLQSPLLPFELQAGDIPFDRFVDDLTIASWTCAKRR